MKLTEIALKRPVFAWMLMLAFLFFGAMALRDLGIGQYPDVDYPVVNIKINWEGAAPEVMELDIIDPVESSLLGIEGVEDITSSAKRGTADITVDFPITKDIDIAIQEIQTRMNEVRSSLPDQIDPPEISKSNPEDRPIMWLSVTASKTSKRELMLYVRDTIKDQFLTVEGVSDIFLGGYIEPNLRVWPDRSALERYQLSVLDLIDTIESEHKELPSGLYETPSKEFSVRTLGEASKVSEFAKLSIKRRGGAPNFNPVSLSEVARVENGLDDIRRLSRVMGNPSVGLGIRKKRGANAVAVAEGIYEKMDRVKAMLPEDMEIGVNYDGTVFVKDSIKELFFTLGLAALLTSMVVFLFLGSPSATFNVMLSIPTAIIGSFIGVWLFGFTINTFTLLALTLAIGLIVDDNIMILENIQRLEKSEKNPWKAALLGTNQMALAALASTLTMIAVFLPVGFMDDVIGRYFFEFSVTLCFALVFSLIDALSLTPMRKASFSKDSSGPQGQYLAKLNQFFDSLSTGYRRMLSFALNQRALSLAIALAAVAGSWPVFQAVKKEFIPPQDQGRLLVRFVAPPGSSLEYTNTKVKKFEQFLQDRKELNRYFLAVGGWSGAEANTGISYVTLKDFQDRPATEEGKVLTQQEFADVVREKMDQVEGIKTIVIDPSLRGPGSSRGFPIEVSLEGPEWSKLSELSEKLKQAMRDAPEFVDVDSNYRGKVPELHILPNREEARKRGVSVADIARVIQALVSGTVVGKFSQGGRRNDIRVKLERTQISNTEAIQSLQVRNNRGELIPLGEVTIIKKEKGIQEIYRNNRSRSITVTANLGGETSLDTALAKVQKLGKKILPKNYTIREVGSSQEYRENIFDFLVIFLTGLAAAYMVLASQFNSFTHPILILLAIPFSLVGAFAALWVGGLSLNLYSAIGMILLAGIVVKNSILLVDVTNQKRQQHRAVNESLLEACPIRLRPILMTSLSTVAGAIPAALALGPGSETRVPLATVIIGGILFSTLMTLFIVPVSYSVLEGMKSIFSKGKTSSKL